MSREDDWFLKEASKVLNGRVVQHNQGKQAFKRIRRNLGLHVCREPLPAHIECRLIPSGLILTAETINMNPNYYDGNLELVTKGYDNG